MNVIQRSQQTASDVQSEAGIDDQGECDHGWAYSLGETVQRLSALVPIQ
jgi:hypothetical protein